MNIQRRKYNFPWKYIELKAVIPGVLPIPLYDLLSLSKMIC